ncbi:retrovirus-related pol polyprotein from transposon TNT 1-94 [Tanacetum coccineum]
MDKKDSDFDEILDDLDSNHESGNLLNFPIFLTTNEFSINCQQDVDLEKEEAKVKDDDDDGVIQPLISQPIHTTPPNDDYVAPATKSILDELLEEFEDEIVNVTMVDEEAAKDPQSHFTEIQGFNSKGMEFEPYRLCTSGGAWILNKLQGSITKRTSWMLYRWLVKLLVMLDIARGSRLGAWLRACCLFIITNKANYRTQRRDYGWTMCTSQAYDRIHAMTVHFGSIAGGLDPVNPVIRLPIKRGISSGTRRSHISLLSTRNVAFAKFLAQIIKLRAHFSDYIVKRVRLDNAGEFTSHAFNDYCMFVGIVVEHLVSHVYTQNGLAKSLIKRLQLIARSLIMRTKLLVSMWGHAILHVASLIRLRPNANHKYSHIQLASGQEPNISHLRIFGCALYVPIAPPQRIKMGPQRRLEIYVGYETSSIIRYLEPLTCDLFTARFDDCRFDEAVSRN